MDTGESYKILGLKEGATRFEVRQAYHDLLHIWQPDRVGKTLRLQKRAQEQLALINEAYAVLDALLPKPSGTAAEEEPALPAMLPEKEKPKTARPWDLPPESPAAPPGPLADPPVVDLNYVPDGPPPPKIPLAAKMRDVRYEVGRNVAKVIPFSRKKVFLACVLVVVVPVGAFYLQHYLLSDETPAVVPVTPSARVATPHPAPPDSAAPPATIATDAPPPATQPETQPAVAQSQPAPATHVVDVTPPVPDPVPDPVPARAPDERATTLAELAKLGLAPDAKMPLDQLSALLVRARIAHELAAAGIRADPQRTSLEQIKEMQVKADLAHQIEQMTGAKLNIADFSLPDLRDMRARAVIVQKIAQNGIRVDLNRYNQTELSDLLRRSEIIRDLQAKYGVHVDDINKYTVIELDEMLRTAEARPPRAATHP